MRVFVAVTLALLAGSPAVAQEVDFTEKIKPTCELAGLVARPPEGWINIPIEGARPGHLGCQMMRIVDEELTGILRIRSVAAPAPEFNAKGDPSALIASERTILKRMNIDVAAKPLWTRDKVPIKGPGFSQAGGAGYAATIEGPYVPQEAHFLTFRAEEALYLITLVTPAKSHAPEVYERNTDDFGIVMRSMNVK